MHNFDHDQDANPKIFASNWNYFLTFYFLLFFHSIMAGMSCIQKLKAEIQNLKTTFPITHSQLQIPSANVDEVTCHFIDSQGNKHRINATIWENYPSVPPVWFSESENSHINEAIEKLSESARSNHIGYQVRFILKELCSKFDMPIPSECDQLETIVNNAHASANNVNAVVEDNESSEESEFDSDSEPDEKVEIPKSKYRVSRYEHAKSFGWFWLFLIIFQTI